MSTDSTVTAWAKKVTTPAELRRLLRHVQDESGRSIRALGAENARAKDQAGLSRSTISRHLSGDGDLPLRFVESFAVACGVSETERDALVTAWRRVRGVPTEASTTAPDQRSESDAAARPTADPGHLTTLRVMMEVATRLDGRNGGLAAARRLYERVRTARSEILGPDDPLTLEAAHNLGTVLAQLDQHTAASRVLSETYEARRRVLGPEASATLSTLENLATTTAEMGHLDAAIELFEQVLLARQPETSPGHARYADTAEKLMTALDRAGDHVRRKQVARELARARTASGDPPD
ncbi:tetratricopeptide repeat protein [Micromonospora sp. NPDC023956]|uniref:helix-turn-helix domain-containing protein n=1 Tax=Micromonospora sp. NPDC023956 TaxID=3155722 RepID=UPI0034030C46